MRRFFAVIIALALAGSSFAQDAGTVKVTSARANVRSEPNDKAPVVAQVPLGTVLTLKAIEGDWFKIQLPPTAGGIKVEAFISRKVAVVEKAGAAGSTTTTLPAAKPAAVGPPPDPSGISVAWASNGKATWLTSRVAQIGQLSDRADAVRAIAAALPAQLHPPMDAGPTQVAYAWVLDEAAVAGAVSDRRPVFLVDFKNVAGVNASDLAPALVRLAPASSGRRVIGMVRGRADEISRTTADWDVMRDFRQELIKAAVQVVEPGSVRIQPAVDLAPGEYAVVIRPPRKRLIGSIVLSDGGEGRLFRTVWPFAVK